MAHEQLNDEIQDEIFRIDELFRSKSSENECLSGKEEIEFANYGDETDD